MHKARELKKITYEAKFNKLKEFAKNNRELVSFVQSKLLDAAQDGKYSEIINFEEEPIQHRDKISDTIDYLRHLGFRAQHLGSNKYIIDVEWYDE